MFDTRLVHSFGSFTAIADSMLVDISSLLFLKIVAFVTPLACTSVWF